MRSSAHRRSERRQGWLSGKGGFGGSFSRKQQAIHQPIVFDPHSAIAAFGLRQRKSHSTEVRCLRHVHVHGGRHRLHTFDHVPKDMVLRRHHIIGPKHGQVTLHGLDVGFREGRPRSFGRDPVDGR